MQNKLCKITIYFLILSFSTASAQKLVNSPFARFNIGSLEPSGSFRSIAMGGAAIAMRDNNSIYYTNPASYSSLDTNSFIFDFGIDYGFNILSDGSAKYSSRDVNFDHLVMGFPLSKRWGIATGILPLSNGYFNISKNISEEDPDFDPVMGTYTESHLGSGSFTKFFLGTGIDISKNFSAGVNFSLLFGNVDRANEYIFSEYDGLYNTRNEESLQISGVNLDYGLQYSGNLKNNYFVNAGASLSPDKKYNSAFNQVSFIYSVYRIRDTIPNSVNNDETDTFLPGTLRLGVSFGKKDKFVTGIDYLSTKWSKAEISGSEGYHGDTETFIFGVEYIPDKTSNYSFLKRIEYRLGGHTGDNYLVLNDMQVKEYGLSFGMGIPMRRSLSKTNLFIDYTRKYVPENSLIPSEDYFSIGVSINMYDFWFIKSRYD